MARRALDIRGRIRHSSHMTITLYYVLVTIMLGLLVGLLMGGGFAFACRLRELDAPDGEVPPG